MQLLERREQISSEIQRFLEALSNDGFDIGVRESLKAHQLAAILAEQNLGIERSQYRAMFTALIARDLDEQRRVAELLDSVVNDARLPAPSRSPSVSTTATALPRNPKHLGKILAAIAAVVAIVVFFGLAYVTPIISTPATGPKIESNRGSFANPLPAVTTAAAWQRRAATVAPLL